ncbi:unnamed protein product [Lampetra fluviatilis]
MAVSGAEGTDEMVTGDSAGVQDVIDGAGPFSSSGIEEGWRRVAEQIDSLRSVLLKLVTLVATGPEQPRIGPRDGESSGGPEPSAIVASARLPAIADMWQGAAILGAPPVSLPEDSAPGGLPPATENLDSVALQTPPRLQLEGAPVPALPDARDSGLDESPPGAECDDPAALLILDAQVPASNGPPPAGSWDGRAGVPY